MEQNNFKINQDNMKPPSRLQRWAPYIVITVVSSFLGGMMAGIALPIVLKDLKNQATVTQKIIFEDKANLYSKDNPVINVAKQVGPAIVEISNKAKYTDENHNDINVDRGDGSGVIIDKRGYIVTNHHVINDAEKLVVTLSNGKVVPARIIGSDVRTDLAVIKIDVPDLTVAKFGDSDKLMVGQLVVAIGNPLGKKYSHTVTAGILSAKNRIVDVGIQTFKLLQTDAAINPGNSGGALLNSDGEIIGINSAKIISEDIEGIGFSIPSNDAKPIIQDIINKGRVIRPWLGISDANRAAIFNAPSLDKLPGQKNPHQSLPGGHPSMNIPKDEGKGVRIIVYTDTPAHKAGLQNDDIIIAVNKHPITTFFSLQQVIGSYKIGDKIKVTILRKGKELTKEVTLGEMPAK